ncbi:uncharacterized protein UTRI_05194 [Ustilago trichophora]|uniref:Uncharacterized protein n=1 Tax=Ustilago trichophora TaxID=86804 RepID=A0A5C3ELF2_9BASI|nr:uncharacterized protein UTRI_05194 [Ustilago trichophora]
MDLRKETDHVFHPSSIPVDRAAKQRQERRQSCRLCFYASVAFLALLGGFLTIGGGYLASKLLKDFLFPTKPYALKRQEVSRYNASQVHPLIDASSTFDIHATVWQDVTDLLARGEKLPHRDVSWTFVEYELVHRSVGGFAKNETRTEVVLWSGVIARGAKPESKIHNSIHLRVPVAPLYTSNLGRSSLRATFSIAVPDDQARILGTFRNVSSVFTSETPAMPILPRRPDFAEKRPDHDLNTALADTGISTSLLELVPSPWFRTTDDGKPATSTIPSSRDPSISPFYGAHLQNIRFLDLSSNETNQTAPGHLPEFRNADGTILLPHFKTRSRLGMVRATDVFDNFTFQSQHLVATIQMRRACKNSVDWPCIREYRKHAFETMLTFAQTPRLASTTPSSEDEEQSEENHFYHAPVLTQAMQGSPIYQRRIPQRLPTLDQKDEPVTLKTNASAACEIPPARLDASRQYFEFDWHIYFSSHTLQRVAVAESGFTTLVRPPPAPLGPGEEGDKQLVANSIPTLTSSISIEKALNGDRYHANDHPSRLVLSSFGLFFWQVIGDQILLFYFWYTRQRSTGLWIEAQWMWVGSQVLNFAAGIIRPFLEDEEDPWPSFVGVFWRGTALFHVPFVITTILHLVRPPSFNLKTWWRRNPIKYRRRRLTRREQRSVALSKTIDKRPFYALFLAVFAFCFIRDYNLLQFNPADRCLVDDLGGNAAFPLSRRIFEEGVAATSDAMLHTYLFAQIWFNYRSSTFTGSFRISAIGSAIVMVTMTVIVSLDSFASWTDKRHSEPVGLEAVLQMVAPLLLCYQALTYKGVPQVDASEEDD